ncbi:hypothetical protein ACI7YT_12275 [Microbacterium sp. M]|uniref:hypothetical protein n=1 Tax=Microbacterium sp. M TaxID=3377125 RepID=UPI00386AEC91
MREKCSCGAKFKIVQRTPWTTDGFERALEAVKDWRANHRHEMPAAEPEELPLIHESGSSHERLGSYLSTENDIPFGFTRNEVR